MVQTRSSRKTVWIAAGIVLAISLLILGIFVARTINEGNHLAKYSTAEECRTAITAGDTDPIAYENLAAFQIADNHDDQAIQTLRQCLKANPDDRFAKALLSGTLADNGKKEEAIALSKELAQSDDRWGKRARRELHRNHIPGY